MLSASRAHAVDTHESKRHATPSAILPVQMDMATMVRMPKFANMTNPLNTHFKNQLLSFRSLIIWQYKFLSNQKTGSANALSAFLLKNMTSNA